MATALFEIGTEELPPGEIDPAIDHLATSISAGCAEHRLAIGAIETFATPRRLAIRINDVAAAASDLEETVLGPAARIAFDDDGNPTRAAQGFARGKGVDPATLIRVSTDKGEYVAARVKEAGRSAADILAELFTAAFASIPWKRSMRWGWRDEAFARPIKWIVALIDDAVLDVSFAGISADRRTRGHRFLSPDEITITNPAAYESALRDAMVVASVEERKATILNVVDSALRAAGFEPIADPELADEVVHLVEWPVPLVGTFAEELLEVPREVLITSMKKHQRYFACEDSDGKLANAFCFVSNMKVPDPDVVIAGNRRVLVARLEDARFFYREDRKISLEERCEKLKTIKYIDGLGSVADRADRLVGLATWIATRVSDGEPGDDGLVGTAARAAALAKADLASGMVYEFPSLQGIMGSYYALADGESAEVAAAIDEHYAPRGASDAPAATRAGAVVALADKLDAIVGCYALGLIPTGSADPYGLRRAAIGILRTLSSAGFKFDLDDALGAAWDQLPDGEIAAREKVIGESSTFIRERLRVLIADEVPGDIAAAAAAVFSNDVASVQARARVLNELREGADFEPLAAAFKRAVNIVRKATEAGDELATALAAGTLSIDESLLEDGAERGLATAIRDAEASVGEDLGVGRLREAAESLIALKVPLDAYFDDVMVNADDPKVRANRLGMLARLRALFLTFADLSLIQSRSN